MPTETRTSITSHGLYNGGMRIITLNANGIRSAGSKGVFDWIATQEPDVVCLQETKAQERADRAMRCIVRRVITATTTTRRRRATAASAIYAKRKPDRVTDRLRLERVRSRRTLSRSAVRQAVGRLALPAVRLVGRGAAAGEVSFPRRSSCRICGRSSASGATTSSAATGTSRTRRSTCATGARTRRTPASCREERAWLDQLFGDVGYVDGFREINPQPDQYTGGRTAARPGRRTSGGASTIRS